VLDITKIKAKVKIGVGYGSDYKVDSIKLKVKFKDPNKFRKVKLQECIVIHNWRQKETKIAFLERCSMFLSNKEYIVQTAQDMVKEYFKNQGENSNENTLEAELGVLLKSINKNDLVIEVEI
jgi:hypothetical protein